LNHVTLKIKKKHLNLTIRSQVIQAIRDFFTHQNFLEVETPIRCPSLIPEAQIDPVSSDEFYLQASPELCMKRMLSKGYDKIFQICKTFRKDERGSFHLPELTLLEWYATGCTYLDLMDQCQALIMFISNQLDYGNQIEYQGKSIDLGISWQKMTVKTAFATHADITLETALASDTFDEVLSFEIEPNLGFSCPTFLMDYPSCLASLAKIKSDDPDYAQRVELYISGIELANGFTELTDPEEQEQRFNKENLLRKQQGKNPLPLPNQFLKDLKNMPPAAGMALGVDRLVMLFANVSSIDEIVAFTPEQL